MFQISKSLAGFENYLHKFISKKLNNTCKNEIATPLGIVSVCFPGCDMYPVVPWQWQVTGQEGPLI